MAVLSCHVSMLAAPPKSVTVSKFPPGTFVESHDLTTERQAREGDRRKTLHEPGYAANGSLLVGEKGIIYLDDA